MKNGICFFLQMLFYIGLSAQSNFKGPGITLQNNGASGKYIDLGDVFNNMAFPMTFEAWVKPESAPSSLYSIFTTENDNNVYSGLWIRFTSSKTIEFEIGDGLGNGPGYRRGFRTTTSLQLTKWTHIAIVANSITDVKFYFNGEQANQVPSDGTSSVTNMISSSSTASIGRHLNIFSDLYFDGSIDEVRLWKISRTQNEIRDYMCKKIMATPSGLIGYWKIDESYTTSSVLDYALPAEDGVVMGQMNKITSGAPIGDESKYLYTSNWTGINVGLGSSAGDSLSASSISNATTGIQVYRVDTLPYYASGLTCPAPYYFGVFSISAGSNSTYKSTYYYDFNNGMINAVNESQAELFRHADAAALSWTNSNAILNTGSDFLEKGNETYRAEYILDVPLILQVSNDTTICPGDSVQLLVSGATDYLWSPASGLNCVTCSNPIATPSVSTTYVVTATNGSCIKTDTVVITVNSSLLLSVSADTSICVGESVQLFATGALTYTWSPANGLSCTNCSNPVASPDESITYSVTAFSGGCSMTGIVTVEVDSMPLLVVSNDTTICTGDQIQLMASGATNYSWSPSSGLSCTDCADPLASPLTTTTYLVTGSNGTCDTTASINIKVADLILDAGIYQIIGTGSSTQLNGSGAETYSWSPGSSLNDSTISSPTATPLQTTTYTLTGSANGCIKIDTVTIIVVDPCKFILLPAAFSPNHDGVNDLLSVISISDPVLYYFRVFNRWGELVFETNSSGTGWDGTYKGKNQEMGTYVYAISFDCRGTKQMKKGNVTLLR